MKILHLSTYGSSGGAAIAASRCVKALSDSGLDCFLLTLDNASSVSPYIKLKSMIFNRIELRLSNILDSGSQILQTYGFLGAAGLALVRYINSSAIDLVHIHWVQGGFLSLKQISLIEKPIVWHLHDLWPLSTAGHYPSAIAQASPSTIRQLIEKEAALSSPLSQRSLYVKQQLVNRRRIGFVSPSKWIYNLSSALLERSKSFSVEIPFPSPLKYRRGNSDELDICRGDYHLRISIGGSGFFSNPYKGSSDALNVLEFLGRNNIRVMILCFGEIPPASFVERVSCYHHLIGFGCIEQAEVIRCLRGSDLYLSTSWLESYGLVVEEALSNGTPCLAYSDTGSESIVRHMVDGICIPYRNTVKMAEAVLYLASNPVSLSWLQSGAKRRLSTESIFLAETKKLYKRIAFEG